MDLKTALLQLTSSDDPEANLPATEGLIGHAAAEGAGVTHVTLDLDAVAATRAKIPSLANARNFTGPG